MPGVLKRPHDLVDAGGLDGPADAPERKRVALDQVNGESSDRRQVNGGQVSPGFAPDGIVPDQKLAAAVREATSSDEVPELHHITGSYVPLTALVDRLAQETHNELDQLIGELADMQAGQVNGYGSAHAVQINVQKKERLFNFAHNARVKFIKLLVLSQWSREADAVGRLIDLHSWIVFRKEEYRNAVNWMGELKRMTATMKSPPPDLRTALQVLSTGKADWIEDPIELDSDDLSMAEMLKGIRTINTLLTIRLNLHETIPVEMMDFSIASGRATFRVNDEFEVDLSIADEDQTSQLYFIDFRFNFSPCTSELPDGPLRDYIESRTNEALRTDGLTGCYNFLHELVLTHKLSILRQQAFELGRGRWSEHIKVEPVHRALVVQYWTNRPGPKSWIEIGARKNTVQENSSEELSGLGIRWHRQGKEVTEHGLELDDSNLSLETVLKQAIAKHTNHIFKETKRKLKMGSVYKKGILTAKHRAHPTEPAECALSIQMSFAMTIRIVQEPISGFFAISPTSEMHFHAEHDLNRLRDPASDAHRRLAYLRCNEVLHQVRHMARVRRWQIMETYRPNQETIKRLFRAESVCTAFYKVPKWDRNWILALTTSLEGDKWWLVETRDAPRNPTPMDFASGSYQPLHKSLRINLNHDVTLVFDPSHAILSTIERAAAAVLSQFVDARELTRRKLQYEQLPPRKSTARIDIPELLIHFPPEGTSGAAPRPWSTDMVKAVFVGLSRTEGMITTILSGKLTRRIPNVERFNAHMDSALAFHPQNGTFSFRLKTAIGESSVGEVQKRFARIGTLVKLMNITSRHKLDVTRLALNSFSFVYGSAHSTTDIMGLSTPSLMATIDFPDDQPERIKLPAGNPHLRILDHLNRTLLLPNGFEDVLSTLQWTVDLLKAFSAMEHRSRPDGVRVYILPRSATAFLIRFNAPRIRAQIEARVRFQSDERVVWFSDPRFTINKVPGSGSSASPTKSKTALKAAAGKEADAEADRMRVATLRQAWQNLCKVKGPAWEALGSGLLAPAQAAWPCVDHIDAVLGGAVAEAGIDSGEEVEKHDDKDVSAKREVVTLDD